MMETEKTALTPGEESEESKTTEKESGTLEKKDKIIVNDTPDNRNQSI